jgi:hypothetical protein
MPFICEFGTHRIWVGAPFSARVQWEPLPSSLNSADSLSVSLQCVDAEDGNLHGSRIERTFALAPNQPIRIELPTEHLIPGAYELTVSLPSFESWVAPRPLWVLAKEQFLRLIREEAEEEFLAATPLERVEDLIATVEAVISERLRAPIFDQHLSVPVGAPRRLRERISIVAPSAEGTFERSISSAPIRWTTEAMIDAINYLAIDGARSSTFSIEIARTTFGLRFRGILNEPISAEMYKSFSDRESSELHLLNARRDLRDFAVEIKVAPFSTQVELSVQQAIEGHPVLKIDPSQADRPVKVRTADNRWR